MIEPITKTRIDLRIFSFLICCLMSLSARSQLIINLQGPEYAAVCDTLKYEILLDYSGDGNMPQNTIELSTDNEIEYIDVVSSPYVRNIRRDSSELQIDIQGIPSCGKARIIARFLVPCYLSYKSVEAGITYSINQQPVNSGKVITQIEILQVFIQAGEWNPSPNLNSDIHIKVTNTGNVNIGDLFLEFASFLNKASFQSASIGSKIDDKTLKILKSHWISAGGTESGLSPGQTVEITLIFKWQGCFPDQMQISPYFKCNENRCEDLSPAVIPPFERTNTATMRRISPLKFGVCNLEDTYFTLKNTAPTDHTYNGMMNIQLWIDPGQHNFKILEDCIERIQANIDGKDFPVIFDQVKGGYKVDLSTLRQGQTSMTDLNFDNKWNDLAPGDSIIIKLSIQTKGICYETCSSSIVDRRSEFLVRAFYLDYCNSGQIASHPENFKFPHSNRIDLPAVGKEGNFTFIQEGEKWTSYHGSGARLDGFRNACNSGRISLILNYPKSIIPVMDELYYVKEAGDTLKVGGTAINNQLIITIPHSENPQIILVNWIPICYDGDYIIGNTDKPACEQCMAFNPKEIFGELKFECDLPCSYEAQLICYRSPAFITNCALDYRMLSLDFIKGQFNRISTGFTDASLSVKAATLPPGVIDNWGIPGDTALFKAQFYVDCLDSIKELNLYLNIGNNNEENYYQVVNSHITGYDTNTGTVTGTCEADFAAQGNLPNHVAFSSIKSSFLHENLLANLPDNTDSISFAISFSIHDPYLDMSSYELIIEEKLDSCIRYFEQDLYQFSIFSAGLPGSIRSELAYHSDSPSPLWEPHKPPDTSEYVTPCKLIYSGILLKGDLPSGYQNIGPVGDNMEFRPLPLVTHFSISFPSEWEVITNEAGVYRHASNSTFEYPQYELIHTARFLNVTEVNGIKTYHFEGNPPGQNLYVAFNRHYYFLVPYSIPCSEDEAFRTINIVYTLDPSIYGLPAKTYNTSIPVIPLHPKLYTTKRAQALTSEFITWSSLINHGVYPYPSSMNGVNSRGKISFKSSNPNLEFTDFYFSRLLTLDTIPSALTKTGDTWYADIPVSLYPARYFWNYKTSGHSCGVDTIYMEWQPSCLDSDPSCSSIVLRDTMIVYSYNPLPDLVLEESTPVWTPCMDNEVIISIKNKGSGGLRVPEVYLNLPEGLSLESAEFADYPIAAPEIIAPLPGEPQWLLKFNSSELNPIPPFQDNALSEFRLKLHFSVACDIELPFKWEAFLSGIRPCGDSIQSRINVSPYLYFEESSLSDPVAWNFKMQAGPDCASGTEMFIDITKINQNWQASSRDSILVILEGNLIYIPGTAVNSTGQSLPDPTIRYDDGKLRLLWGGLPVLLQSLTSTFSFRIGHECSETCEPIAVSLALLGFQNLQCTQSPVNCHTQILQSFKTWEDVRLRGNFLQQVTDVIIEETGNQLYEMSARIGIRSERHTSYNGPVVIKLFQDNNLNNWLDPGELLHIILNEDQFNLTDDFWNWFEFSSEFPVDALCNLRIAIELPEKCQCEPSVLAIDPQIWLEGISTGRHCAGTAMIIDTDAIPFCSIDFDNNIHLKKVGSQYIFIKDLEPGQSSDIEELFYQINCGVCNFRDTLYIETYQILGEILELNSIKCHADSNGSLLFKAEDENIQLNYNWNVHGQISAQIDNLSAGNYALTISDQHQCSFIFSYSLIEPDTLFGIHTLSSSLCEEDNPTNLKLTASGGIPPYSFQWHSGETTDELQDIRFGTYTFTITDFNDCIFEETIRLDEPIWYDFEWQTTDATCAELSDGEILLDLPDGPVYSILIDNNHSGNQNKITGLSAKDYELIVQDQTGCSRKLKITIKNKPSFNVSLLSDTTMYLGDTLQLFGDIDRLGNYNFEWSPAEWLDCPDCESVNIFIIRPLRVELLVTNQLGCKDSAGIDILVDERIRIFVPNAFSPNSDGINDLLRAYSGPEIEEILLFNIYDRWGSRIFEQSNISPKADDWGWDGLARNMEMQPGVFVYHLKVRLINGNEATLGGEFLLLR